MWETLKALAPFLGIILLLGLINIFQRRSDFVYDKFYKTKWYHKNFITPYSKILGEELKKRGFFVEYEKSVEYQTPNGPKYIHIDIAITQAQLNIEVDGSQHNWKIKQALSDLKRNYHSLAKGYLTIHIPNVLIKRKLPETVEYLEKIIRLRQQ